MASCALHNFLMSRLGYAYAPHKCFDRENTEDGTVASGLTTQNSNLQALQRTHPGNVTVSAKDIRNKFVKYFASEGKVSWQTDFIN